MNESDFIGHIKQKAKSFIKSIASDNVRIVSHLDADGICAAAIMINALQNEDIVYSTIIVPQLDRQIIMELNEESYSSYIFLDLGSGQLNDISRLMKGKKVLILDHHKPQESDNSNEAENKGNIIHINPHYYGINGSKEISGSGVTYLFCREISKDKSSMPHLAVIGAIGDNQESHGFTGINKEIEKEAIESGALSVKQSLRLFGSQTRPLYKLLEYCYNPFIPGVSGSESGSIEFLKSLNINPKAGKSWKMLAHLTDEELKRLIEGIILRRMNEEKPEEIVGPVYILNKEKDGTFKDAREFSTLLNACGRMGKAALGIGACLGDENIKKKALAVLKEYKKEIISALSWLNESIKRKDSKNIYESKKFLIINGSYNIPATIAGTIASIITKSELVADKDFIVSMARTENNKTKVSIRANELKRKDSDVREIMKAIIELTGDGEFGGHKYAAGAMIDTEKESRFIECCKLILEKQCIEEQIRA